MSHIMGSVGATPASSLLPFGFNFRLRRTAHPAGAWRFWNADLLVLIAKTFFTLQVWLCRPGYPYHNRQLFYLTT
jgi:hypothetical protein